MIGWRDEEERGGTRRGEEGRGGARRDEEGRGGTSTKDQFERALRAWVHVRRDWVASARGVCVEGR